LAFGRYALRKFGKRHSMAIEYRDATGDDIDRLRDFLSEQGWAERVRDRSRLHAMVERADRTVLATRPRDDPKNPVTGVFSTRSPDRPNPIGLHRVRVLERHGLRVRVGPLEALDGTPIVDLKPVLTAQEG